MLIETERPYRRGRGNKSGLTRFIEESIGEFIDSGYDCAMLTGYKMFGKQTKYVYECAYRAAKAVDGVSVKTSDGNIYLVKE